MHSISTFLLPFVLLLSHTNGSFGSSLGCGTKMTPFLLLFNFDVSLPRAREAAGLRSSSVAVPARGQFICLCASPPHLQSVECRALWMGGAVRPVVALTRHV